MRDSDLISYADDNSQFGSNTPWAQAAAGYKAPAKESTKAPATSPLESFRKAEAETLTDKVTGPTGDTGPTGPTTTTTTTSINKTTGGTTAGGIDPEVQAYLDKLNAKLDANAAAEVAAAQREKVSAFNILKDEFARYGLGSLVEGIRGLMTDGTPASEFALKLRETDAYKKRFAANEQRIARGLSALSPAEYIGLEDQYQNLMRNYGLPASYYSEVTDPVTGIKRQTGFDKLIAGDVSAAELEDRISTAQQRVLNTNPEVLKALKQFYPDLGNADILAYTLNPEQGLADIKRKVTAAEIGGAALAAGLQASGGTAESLAGYGITKQQAMQGYQNIAEMLPRGSQLASIYGEDPYTQAVAEAETFGMAGSTEATKKRKKLAALETGSFSGSSGVGAIGRERPSYQSQTYGAGSY